MAKNIDLEQLANEITQAITEYTEDVEAGIKKVVNKTSDKVLKEVKTNHPFKDRTGDYSKGWVNTKQDKNGIIKRTVWNKKHYRRVHLLEFGHLTRNGKRVKAYPHLEPAYEKHAKNVDKEIKKIIKNGGDT